MKRSPVGLTLEEERHFPSCWGLAWVGIVPFIGVVLGCVASLERQEKDTYADWKEGKFCDWHNDLCRYSFVRKIPA